MRTAVLAVMVFAACFYSVMDTLWIIRIPEYKELYGKVPGYGWAWIGLCSFGALAYSTLSVLLGSGFVK
jgi:hypothetical protein